MSRAERRAHIGTGYLFDATRKTLCEKEKEKRWQQLYKQTLVLQDDVGKLKNDKDFISMKFRGFVAQMDYFLKNMHDMTDAEIQRRSNAFMRDYDDIRAEIDEIGIEMD